MSDGNFTPGTLHTQGKISIEKINKRGIGKIFYRMNGHCYILAPTWLMSKAELTHPFVACNINIKSQATIMVSCNKLKVIV